MEQGVSLCTGCPKKRDRNCTIGKMRKWPYLGTGAKNEENKPTFFSQTFEVGEKKVGLFYSFLAPVPRYGHFLIPK